MPSLDAAADNCEDNAPALFDVAENYIGGYGERVIRFAEHDEDVHDEDDRRRGRGVPPPTTGPTDAKAPAWWVREAEQIILTLVASGHTVTSDDLRARYPHEPSATGAAIGALFKRLGREGRLELVGHRPSGRPEARGRVVGIWRAPGGAR